MCACSRSVKRSVQTFLLKKFGQGVCDFEIVRIRHRKVSVASDSYFRYHNYIRKEVERLGGMSLLGAGLLL